MVKHSASNRAVPADLLRIKTMIETRRAPHDAAAVSHAGRDWLIAEAPGV